MYVIRNAHKLGTTQQDNEDVRWEKGKSSNFPRE